MLLVLLVAGVVVATTSEVPAQFDPFATPDGGSAPGAQAMAPVPPSAVQPPTVTIMGPPPTAVSPPVVGEPIYGPVYQSPSCQVISDVPVGEAMGSVCEPPAAMPWLQPAPGRLIAGDPNTWWDFKFLARGYYLNDQRIEWSGQEATFGAEGVLAPVLRHRYGGWVASVEGEFYLNQPFDRNILVDTAERRSYLSNFNVQPFEISQLQIRAETEHWLFAAGKMETPFGRTYFPIYTNSRLDAPFIRTESIHWRETGLLMRWRPGLFVGDVALTNGGDDRDTNSSKALVSRLGLEGENWAVGASFKVQDGTGSEQQKQYNNHAGLDAMFRAGPWTLSGEFIYDEYGFRRPGFDPNDITWIKSIYYRDLNYRDRVPITGIGYYLNLTYQADPWTAVLNYGEFYPAQIGVPQQDVINRRGIGKLAYAFSPHFRNYNVVMLENDGYVAQDNRRRKGVVVLTGLELGF